MITLSQIYDKFESVTSACNVAVKNVFIAQETHVMYVCMYILSPQKED